MTITERAEQAAKWAFGIDPDKFHQTLAQRWYEIGATEQKDIDIKKIISLINSIDVEKFYREAIVLSDGSRIPSKKFIDDIRKTMTE